MGKQREHIYSHQFAGANVTLLKHIGQKEAADAASEMLKSATTMQFMDVPTAATAGAMEVIKLKVSTIPGQVINYLQDFRKVVKYG